MSVITKTSIVKIFPSWENLHLESSAKSISFSEALKPPSSKIMQNSIQHTFWKSHVYLASYTAFVNIYEGAETPSVKRCRFFKRTFPINRDLNDLL